jgi:hypothetical protein
MPAILSHASRSPTRPQTDPLPRLPNPAGRYRTYPALDALVEFRTRGTRAFVSE